VKLRPWYRLAFDERQRIMDEHIATGHKYPSVRINTTYSFGLDDQEFVVAFESNKPEDFLDLVQDLRASESSAYTEREIPIFTCVRRPIGEVLDLLGG
jgi:chlorite dismutase